VLAVAGVLAATPLLAQNIPMREGQWEIVVQMEMAGSKMPEMKVAQCVTAEQLKNLTFGMPGAAGTGNSCKPSDVKVDGGKVTFKLACAGAQPMTADGELTFAGDTYTGFVNMATPQGGQLMAKTSGKRLGECKA
jgi:hypothetical protein